MPGKFDTYADGLESPASNAVIVTPDDNNDLSQSTRAVLIGTAGNLKVTMVGGQTVVLPVQAGYNPIRVVRIWSTGTTAATIVALW